MAEITAAMVKELREKTGAGMMDCKKALATAEGDMDKALTLLREKGLAQADKRAGRQTGEGIIDAYIHMGGRIGVLIEVNCETDFVARNDEFKEFAHDLALQVAAANPQYVHAEDIPQDVLLEERKVLEAQARGEGKPDQVISKIVEGRLGKFYERVCLMEQPFVKDQDKKVAEVLKEKIALIGENINVRRFVRFEVGQE